MKEFTIAKMNIQFAQEISSWIYDEPYSIYSFNGSKETIKELLENNYYAFLVDNHELIGYYCFGISAQIPTLDEEAYKEKALDIGLGLRPDQCGIGKGEDFVKHGLVFAKNNLLNDCHEYRLTVAEFNKRAIQVYRRIGFDHIRNVNYKNSGMPFMIMTYAVSRL